MSSRLSEASFIHIYLRPQILYLRVRALFQGASKEEEGMERDILIPKSNCQVTSALRKLSKGGCVSDVKA